ncbi:hypothetical protein GEMRC1_007958 [Eukaryota sp. GEM-RC1]
MIVIPSSGQKDDLQRLKISKILRQLQTSIDHPVSKCDVSLDGKPILHSSTAAEANLYDGALLNLSQQPPTPPPPSPDPPINTPSTVSNTTLIEPPVLPSSTDLSSLVHDFLNLSRLCYFWERQALSQVDEESNRVNTEVLLSLQQELHQLKLEQDQHSKFRSTTHNSSSGEVFLLRQQLLDYERRLEQEQNENFKLRTELEDLKGNIRVIVRIKPPTDNQSCLVSTNDVTLSIKAKNGLRSFDFSSVLPPTSSQLNVFSTVSGLVGSFVDGYNVSMFAYGATGSGKTYTIAGESNQKELHRGF